MMKELKKIANEAKEQKNVKVEYCEEECPDIVAGIDGKFGLMY